LDTPVNRTHSFLQYLFISSGQSIVQYILNNNSLYIPHSKLTELNNEYQCGLKQYHVQLYGSVTLSLAGHTFFVLDKPSAIRAKIHYTTSNEIGIKVHYPFDIIESLIITYKTKQNPQITELHISPPLLNIRLTNLSCGNAYDIMIYGNNQVGFGLNEYLTGKTEGSGRKFR
jgi:hypothetical protein